jgi:ketosteroid isomerase-like protein
MHRQAYVRTLYFLLFVSVPPAALFAAAESDAQVRNQIMASIQTSLDALRRGDVDDAEMMDTDDWVSITLNQKPVTKQEATAINHKYIDEIKPPAGWNVVWKPENPRTGTMTGVQMYDIRVEGDLAIVLYLVGNSHAETIDGISHQLWNGSHARDTWVKTPAGWKRRKHEKLTVNEKIIDGRTVPN